MVKALLKFAWPTVFSRLTGVLLEIASVFIVAQLGLNALSAYGVAAPLYLTIYMLAISYLLIFSVRASRLIQDKILLSRYLFASLIFALGLSLFIIIIFSILPHLLPFLGQSIQISEMSGQFFYYITLGMPPLLISIVLNQLFVIFGRSRFVLFGSCLQLFIGVVAIYLLTHRYGLGLKGAALGFDISYWSRCIICLFYMLFTCRSQVSFTLSNLADFIADVSFLLTLGWPISLQYGGELLSGSIATLMIGHLYAHALAAQQVATQLRILFIMLPYGLSQANSILTARHSKDDPKTYRSYIDTVLKSSLFIGFVSMLMVLVLANLFSGWYAHLFIHSQSPEIIQLTQIFILWQTARATVRTFPADAPPKDAG